MIINFIIICSFSMKRTGIPVFGERHLVEMDYSL